VERLAALGSIDGHRRTSRRFGAVFRAGRVARGACDSKIQKKLNLEQYQKKQAQPQAPPAGLLLPFGGKREGCHRPIQISPLALLRLEELQIALTRALRTSDSAAPLKRVARRSRELQRPANAVAMFNPEIIEDWRAGAPPQLSPASGSTPDPVQ